jgi:3-oxoacyl-[acyl-carrier protein] reductase
MADDFLGFDGDAVAVVTGAAHGIGREIARAAARHGAAVAAWDVEAEPLEALTQELHAAGGRALAVTVDVTDVEQVGAAMERTVGELGDAAFLVNNAGPSSYGSTNFAAGLTAAVDSVRAVTEAWLGEPGSEGGSVVSISSVAGTLTGGGAADWYAAAKAAIAGYTRYLALHRPRGIRANAIAPGFTRTRRTTTMFQTEAGRVGIERNPLGRAAEPAEIAAAVLFVLSPAASYVNGVLLPVDGGTTIIL